MTKTRGFLTAAALLLGTSACRACHGGDSALPEQGDGGRADAGAGRDAATPYLPPRLAPSDAPRAPLSVVEADLFGLRPKFNDCYRTATRERPGLAGDALFRITIGPEGRVTDVALVSEQGLGTAMLGCLETALRAATFEPPPDGRAAPLHVPLAFRPPADAGARREGGG